MPAAPLPIVAGPRVVDHAVLRVAAWPIEAADPFAAADLAAAARELVAASDGGGAGSDALRDRIHDAVPAVTDAATRRWLLAVRRALVDVEAALPTPPPGPDAPTDLLAAVAAATRRRAEVVDRRVAFAERFELELRRQRLALRDLAGSPRFRAALALAEPTAGVRWESARSKPLSDKARLRRLDATVFHFAMRACGRPTPNGGWSGVAPVVPGAGSEAPAGSGAPVRAEPEPSARRVHVSVDLAPFAAVLAAWAAALGADADHPLQREPTVRAVGPDRWVYLRRDTDPWSFAALDTVAELRDALDDWPPGTVATPAALYRRVGERRGRAVVEHLLACGVLRSALVIPDVADSPAGALAAVTDRLPEALAAPWRTAIEAIDGAAAALGDAFLADDVAGVVAARDEITAHVGRLVDEAGVGPLPDAGVVHLDLAVPWRVAWDAADRSAVSGALASLFDVFAADGSPEAYRLALVERVRAALAAGRAAGATAGDDLVLAGVAATADDWTRTPPPVATRADLERVAGVDPEPAQAGWTAVVGPAVATGGPAVALGPTELGVLAGDRPPAGGATVGAGPGPAGSAVLGLGGGSLWARWGRPQPGMFVSRFAPLLASSAPDADGDPGAGPTVGGSAVVSSLGRALAGLPARRIVGADAPNRNAALRPDLDGVVGWGWSPAAPPAGGPIPVVVDAPVADGGGVLLDEGGGRRSVPVYDAAAIVGGRDPVTRFVRTAAMAAGWELLAWGVPVLDGEIEGWPWLPRVEASATGGARPPVVIGPRRWVLAGEALAAVLAEPDEPTRYLRWRAELERRDVPDRVVARWALVPDAPELLLVTDSPLALRALAERLPAEGSVLVLTELPGDPATWPVHGPEGHHLAELAVTWVRRRDPFDPTVFPGGVVPGAFAAALDALRDATPPLAAGSAIAEAAAVVATHARVVLEELVPPAERAAVAAAAAAWLTRVADGQDPAGAAPTREVPGATPGDAGAPVAVDRLRRDLAALRPVLDAEVGVVAASLAPGRAPDASAVRTQLVARLVHVDAVDRWGEGPDRLRQEAATWSALATAAAADDGPVGPAG